MELKEVFPRITLDIGVEDLEKILQEYLDRRVTGYKTEKLTFRVSEDYDRYDFPIGASLKGLRVELKGVEPLGDSVLGYNL